MAYPENDTCYLCNGVARLTQERREANWGARRVMVDDEFYRCEKCGEEFYRFDMAEEHSRRRAAAFRAEDGLLQPEEVRAIRTSYGLTQAGLEALIGSGEKTVVRWEKGTVAQNATADTLLRVLRDHPEVVARLAEERGVRVKLPKAAGPDVDPPTDEVSPAELDREDVRHAA